jgi:hypothetical protein
MIVIVLVVLEQVPALVIDHCNILVPSVRPVIVVFALVVDVIIPPPLNTLHVPVPVVGVFAAKAAVGELIQTV